MKSKVHPTYKTTYRVANWPAYNRALVRRGDVTVWVSSEAIAAWTASRSGRRGGQRRYSDLAIETALTLRLLSHLPLRQAEGVPARAVRDHASRPLRSRRDDALPAQSAFEAPSAIAGPARRGPPSRARQHGAVPRRGRGVGCRDTRWPRPAWLEEAPPWHRSVRRDPRPHADLRRRVMMRPLPSIYSPRSRVLSCASPLTPPLTRSPSTRPRRRGVRRSSSHRPGRRPSLATARGRPRGIGRSRRCSSSDGAAGKRRQGPIVRAGWRTRSSATRPSSAMAFAPGVQLDRGVRSSSAVRSSIG